MRNRHIFLSFLIVLGPIGASTLESTAWDRGVDAFKSGDYEEATLQFQAFVDNQPDEFQGHYMLAQSLVRLGRRREALLHLRDANKLNPGDLGCQLALGNVYNELGQYSDAVRILQRIDPSLLPPSHQSNLHQMLALAHEQTGDSDLAVDELGKAVRAEPSNPDIHYKYGLAALRVGDTRTALTELAHAKRLDPDNQDTQYAFAQAMVRMARENTGRAREIAFEKAVESATILVSSDPCYDNLMLLASAQLGSHDYESALTTLVEAGKVRPDEWLPLFNLAEAYFQLGRLGDARASARQALEKSSLPGDKSKVRSLLELIDGNLAQTD
jgi:Flp pilus assembly protein TadD